MWDLTTLMNATLALSMILNKKDACRVQWVVSVVKIVISVINVGLSSIMMLPQTYALSNVEMERDLTLNAMMATMMIMMAVQ